MDAWVQSFCVVAFDEEFGQKLVLQFPTVLSEVEQKAVAFLSFPDSNVCGEVGDVFYLFRMRKGTNSTESPIPLSCSTAHDHSYSYGFVYFRQCRDPSKPRGFSQQSFVVLTPRPFYSLFKQAAVQLGTLYFTHGESVLEAAYHCVCAWPPPVPGATVELPLLGTVMPFYVPGQALTLIRELSLAEGLDCILEGVDQTFPGPFQDMSLYTTLGHTLCVTHLWRLWELLLTGQSLLLLADSPTLSSEAILALISTIAPLPFEGDFRPYFTLFDGDFKEFQQQSEEGLGAQVVIGTTNPYFLKALPTWPNILTINERERQIQYFPLSLKSKLKARISPHKQTLRNLMSGESRESLAINNSVLRRHFRELTTAVLQPLYAYCSLDLSICANPVHDLPKFKTFVQGEFLSSLKSQRKIFPLLRYTSRSKAVKLYDSFLSTTAFRNWLAEQRKRATAAAQNTVVTALMEVDVGQRLDLVQAQAIYDRIEEIVKVLQRENAHEDVVLRLKKQQSDLLSLHPPLLHS